MNTALDPVKGLKQSTKLPLSNIDDAMLGFNSKIYESWLTRNGSAKWKGWDFESQLGKIKIPALHISGWFDGDGIGTQRNWEQLARGGNKNQWLIYGPWTHFFNTTDKLGEIDFGSKSLLDLDSLYLRWFDTWLKHKKVGFDSVPKVKYFTMGSNQWNTSTQWPPIASKSETWYFQTTKGELSLTNKSASPFTKTYTYDPASETADTDEIPLVQIQNSDIATHDFRGNRGRIRLQILSKEHRLLCHCAGHRRERENVSVRNLRKNESKLPIRSGQTKTHNTRQNLSSQIQNLGHLPPTQKRSPIRHTPH